MCLVGSQRSVMWNGQALPRIFDSCLRNWARPCCWTTTDPTSIPTNASSGWKPHYLHHPTLMMTAVCRSPRHASRRGFPCFPSRPHEAIKTNVKAEAKATDDALSRPLKDGAPHLFGGASVTRTSLTHPLQIATLSVGERGGAIGVTFAPGKRQDVAMTGSWYRDLDLDLEAIRSWGASHIISLIEPWEFDELQIAALPKRAVSHGLRWYGLPIVDGAAPDSNFLQEWKELEAPICNALLEGRRVAVHCKGGLGRAGTVACMLLLGTKTSLSSTDAIKRVRDVRPGAIETVEQENFLLAWASSRTSIHDTCPAACQRRPTAI